jgi:hypothetical protein
MFLNRNVFALLTSAQTIQTKYAIPECFLSVSWFLQCWCTCVYASTSVNTCHLLPFPPFCLPFFEIFLILLLLFACQLYCCSQRQRTPIVFDVGQPLRLPFNFCDVSLFYDKLEQLCVYRSCSHFAYTDAL